MIQIIAGNEEIFPKLYFFFHEKIDFLDLLACKLLHYIPPEQMTIVGCFSLPQKMDENFQVRVLDYSLRIQ